METHSIESSKQLHEHHRSMLMHGLNNTKPNISNYVYCPETDTWHHRNSMSLKSALKHGWFIRDEILIRYSVYMRGPTTTLIQTTATSTSLVCNTIENGVCIENITDESSVNALVAVADVMRIILRLACVEIGTYACLRSTCKRFKAFVDGFDDSIVAALVNGHVNYNPMRKTNPMRMRITYAIPIVVRLVCVNHPYYLLKYTSNRISMFEELCKTLTNEEKQRVISNFFDVCISSSNIVGYKQVYDSIVNTLISACNLKQLVLPKYLTTDANITVFVRADCSSLSLQSYLAM